MLYIPPATRVPEPANDPFADIDLDGAESLAALMGIAYSLGLDAAGDALFGLIERELYDAGVDPEDIEDAREEVHCKSEHAIGQLKWHLSKVAK